MLPFAYLILISDLMMTAFTARGLWFLHKRWKTPAGDLYNMYFARIRFSIYAAATFLVMSIALRLAASHYAAL